MGMADVEKVKQGLKAHTDECAWVCNENCPYYDPSEYGCCDKLTADALSVIEELQAEIERLTKLEEEKQAERKRKKLEYNRKYRETHREQAYQKLKEWRKNNPEKWKAQKAREREKQRQKRLEGCGTDV